jgi:hypothetical protein
MAVGQAFQAVGNIFSGFEAGKQATYAAKVADYNANVDIANAKQEAMNATANIQAQRLQGQEYLSRQRAAYAASGVLSDTGSAMAVQASSAARMEQSIQQYWAQVQERESSQYAAAQLQLSEGKQQAKMYHLQAAGDFFKAAGNIANAALGVPGSDGSPTTVGDIYSSAKTNISSLFSSSQPYDMSLDKE